MEIAKELRASEKTGLNSDDLQTKIQEKRTILVN